jgi:hypothetical protein
MKKLASIVLLVGLFCVASLKPQVSYATPTAADSAKISNTINNISGAASTADNLATTVLKIKWGKATTFKDSLAAFLENAPKDSAVNAFGNQIANLWEQQQAAQKTGGKWTEQRVVSTTGGIAGAIFTLIGILIGVLGHKKLGGNNTQTTSPPQSGKSS